MLNLLKKIKPLNEVEIGFIIFLGILILFKGISIFFTFNIPYFTNEFSSFHISTSLILIFQAIKSDMMVISLILLGYFILKQISNIIFKKILFFSLGFVICFYVYDTILIFFSNRLFLFDISKFLFEAPHISMILICIGIIALIWVIFYYLLKINYLLKNKTTLLIILLLSLSSIFPYNLESNYTKQNLFTNNIFETNLNLQYLKKYENSFILSKEYENRFENKKGLNNKENVILLIIESFSSIDSYKISEVVDYMPKFDKISEEGILFTNIRSNANTTDGGLVSLLQGVEIIPFTALTEIYNTYKTPNESLADFFNNLGYNSIFLTSGPLSFLNKGTYLKNIKYNTIIGGEEFSNQKTYTFWSAPDEAIYKKGIELITKQNKPFFLTMLTISSHLSYDTPYGKTKESMYKYVDDKLFEFYNNLKKKGFFENGILIIVGDHRKMTPLENGEFEKYGIGAYNRIGGAMFGKGIGTGINNNIFQQTDIYNSIKTYFGNDIKIINNYNDIFSNEQKRQFVLSPFFSDKNRIILSEQYNKRSIFDFTIELYGDETIINNYNGKNEDEILKYLNQLRSYLFENKKIFGINNK